MPQLKITTKRSSEIWKSPDGQRKIHEVIMKVDGQDELFKANTFSDSIAVEGFTGEVETYEREGKGGSQTFVKQVQKESGFKGKTAYTPKDEEAIKAMFAIKTAVSWFSGDADKDPGNILPLAQELFAMVDTVKNSDVISVEGTTVDLNEVFPLGDETIQDL